jgi:hypothetical protein
VSSRQTTDDSSATLFFSGYGEGSGSNRYLEIYNPTNDSISLNDYAFPSTSNGVSTKGEYEYWNNFTDDAIIESGAVFIIADPSADQAILDHANQTYSYLSNGDDGFKLVKKLPSQTNWEGGMEGIDFEVIDTLGDWQGDPGLGWAIDDVENATKDHTLVRKSYIIKGNPDWIDSSNPTV